MKTFLLLALALSCSLALADAPGAEFAAPHRIVDIGGRRLNLFCSGTGSPTVVFESPSGGAAWDWWAVQPKVAAKTRACVYDRAGYGFSDASPRAADAEGAVGDLHALLQAAGVSPPYVLVGNSFGGAVAQLFAWTHPDEVAGLVLVEPMHEDENVRADAITHGKLSEAEGRTFEFGNGCAAQAAKGWDAKSEAYGDCVGGADPSLPAAVGEIDLERRLAPAWWRVRQAERIALAADRDQLRAARRPFGDLPVIVLARGVSPYLFPGKPLSDTGKAIEAANRALLADVAHSSANGEVRVVAGAGHVIQETHPQAVVAAVDDVLAKIKR
ncbi:alpha/beta fold hydrolase [Scleromatobacter humisilvae]|uniref:Alpha/beta hydrolase n=1 Tax=Scleromatobacter humisilvae TaxID=2897159 RepID=A0A9X2C109_9BURK|nr:alpha/beta hydrolase [Scleromatobacter humisilvae]MCK9684470.1 alpha/beta hydrolase [Scleromatobacter humisilvae]